MAELQISRYSSLLFNYDYKAYFEREVSFVQDFHTSDILRVQFSVPDIANIPSDYRFQVFITNKCTKNREQLTVNQLNDTTFYFEITDLSIGSYRCTIEQVYMNKGKRILSFSDFNILPMIELKDTVLIKCTNWRNDFDVDFISSQGEKIYFEYRFKGGFISNEISFKCKNETFRDQTSCLSQLSQLPYYVETLTIGDSYGVNRWVGDKLNLIFSCSEVYINNKRYTRSESSTPEITTIGNYNPLMVFKIDVEPQEFYNHTLEIPNNPIRIHNQPPHSKVFN